MAEMTFNKHAEQVMDALKPVFGVKTYAEVVAKALSLAKIAAAAADDDHIVSMTDKNGKAMTLVLSAK